MSSRGRTSRGRGRGAAGTRSDRDGDMQMGDAPPTGPSRFNPYGAGRGKGKGGARNVSDLGSRLKTIDVTFTGCEGASSKDLVAFILRKTHVKLGNVRGQGNTLVASVYSPMDVKSLMNSNGIKFAGNILSVRQTEGSGDVPMSTGRPSLGNGTTSSDSTIDTLKQFLTTRYSVETKMLDLSRIADDPTLSSFGIVANTTTSSKLFLALMKLLSEQKLDVVSVTLEGNKLKDVSGITTLAHSFPKLRNLSLAQNDIRRYKDLDAWAAKNKLAELQELILTGNPVREDEMAKNREIEYRSEITKRFPSLKLLDGQVISQGITFDVGDDPTSKSAGRVPLPADIVGGFYENPTIQSTAMDFLGRFFPAYDGDRTGMAPFYADNAIFSMSVNVSAPRKKSGGAFSSSSWQNYIHTSRNLTRITQLDARISRTNVGKEQIIQALKHYPASKHDLSDANLFCVDAWSFPTSEGHVHIQVCVHGEFQEKTPQTKQTTKRSFDRTFILGPAPDGQGINGVIIKSDLLVVRAWGGHNAWRPTTPASANDSTQQQQQQQPAAQTNGGSALTPEQSAMMAQLQKDTGLNAQFAGLCLQQLNWDYPAALKVTQDLKASNGLPAEAFVS